MRQYGMPVQIIVRAHGQDSAIGKIEHLIHHLSKGRDVVYAGINGAIFDAGEDEPTPRLPQATTAGSRDYIVNWESNVTADSAEQAATTALGYIRDPFARSREFEVRDAETGTTITVNLDPSR